MKLIGVYGRWNSRAVRILTLCNYDTNKINDRYMSVISTVLKRLS